MGEGCEGEVIYLRVGDRKRNTECHKGITYAGQRGVSNPIVTIEELSGSLSP